ncbi:putative aspartic proteinase-like protein 2 [Forsythia ovata]|uniref:Aspartic proteinase-like protein 2 n=1 Tax=Forsythia ovata TaxID=205694 RepID=A0ABD1U4H3_9LAMI
MAKHMTAPTMTLSCSTSQTGDLTKSDRAVDGIFGFGQQGLFVILQLFSQGVTLNEFSHCLKGDNGGGCILVLGRIVEPNSLHPTCPIRNKAYPLVQKEIQILMSIGLQKDVSGFHPTTTGSGWLTASGKIGDAWIQGGTHLTTDDGLL